MGETLSTINDTYHTQDETLRGVNLLPEAVAKGLSDAALAKLQEPEPVDVDGVSAVLSSE